MNCITETPCTDDAHLDWLREKQAVYGSGGQAPSGSGPNPSVGAAPGVQGDDPTKRFYGRDWGDVTKNCL